MDSHRDVQMTKEMKYIKWPTKRRVAMLVVSVLIGAAAAIILIAAGDEISRYMLSRLF